MTLQCGRARAHIINVLFGPDLGRFRFTYRAAHTVDLWPHVSAVGLRDAAHDVRQAEPHGRPDDDT